MTTSDANGATHRRSAFSLVELLVVIGIVAILLALLTSIIIHVREQAQRVKCANNLRQAAAALHAYGNAHRGKLPKHPYANFASPKVPSWAYQVPRATADALAGSPSKPAALFCASGEAEYDPLGRWLWHKDPGGMCVTGYHWFFIRASNSPPPLELPKRYHTTFKAVDPAHAELAADIVIAFKGEFVGVGSLAPEGLNIVEANVTRTNHLRGDRPTGGNILFLDGHVIWRPFDQMKLRGGPNELWF